MSWVSGEVCKYCGGYASHIGGCEDDFCGECGEEFEACVCEDSEGEQPDLATLENAFDI